MNSLLRAPRPGGRRIERKPGARELRTRDARRMKGHFDPMKTNKKTPLVYEHKCSCGAEFYDSNPCGKGTVIAIELQKNGKMKVRSNIKDVIVMVWDGKAGPAFKHQPFEVYKDA